MQIQEYQNIFENESKHFFYISNHKTTISLLKKYIESSEGTNILDAGCGTGLLLRKLNSFGKTWGVDVSSEALKFARKRKLKRLFQSSVEKLPFKGKTFNVIVCIDVIYHRRVNSDTKALAEFYRVLAPGGILILKVPAYECLRGHHDVIVETKHRYTKKEVIGKLKESRFDIIKITYTNLHILPLALIKRFIINNLFAGEPKSDVQKIPDFLNSLLIFANSVENKIITYFDLPLGLSIYAVCKKPKPQVTK